MVVFVEEEIKFKWGKFVCEEDMLLKVGIYYGDMKGRYVERIVFFE